jgi:hypothetical protein
MPEVQAFWSVFGAVDVEVGCFVCLCAEAV